MNKKLVNKHEKKLAKSLGGKTRPASGAMAHAKGDIQAGDFLIDDKSTDLDSIRVTREMLVKISKEAREAGKTPCLSLSFKGAGVLSQSWFCIPQYVFDERCLNGS